MHCLSRCLAAPLRSPRRPPARTPLVISYDFKGRSCFQSESLPGAERVRKYLRDPPVGEGEWDPEAFETSNGESLDCSQTHEESSKR